MERINPRVLERISKATPAPRLEALRVMDRMEEEARRNPMASSRFAAESLRWTPIGPSQGRVTAVAVDPQNADTLYIGGAGGGVWKSIDGGKSWSAITDNQPSLAVGCIAIDPLKPQTIYVGTGEMNPIYSYYGVGILKSTDGGSTWTHLPGPFLGPFDTDDAYGGAYVGWIAIHPTNTNILLAAVRIFDTGPLWLATPSRSPSEIRPGALISPP
jgi:hypothetical protein